MSNPGPFAEDLAAPGGLLSSRDGHDAGYFTDLECCERLPGFRKFALESPAAAIAAHLCSSQTTRLIYDQLFVKPFEDERARKAVTPFHQDMSYWNVQGEQIVSVFVALDDVDESECLQFVAGSHRWPEHQPVHFASGEPYGSSRDESGGVQYGAGSKPLPILPAQAASAPTLSWSLGAGDCLCFHGRTVHGGPGSWGRALSVRFAGDDATWVNKPLERSAIPATAKPLPSEVADGVPLGSLVRRGEQVVCVESKQEEGEAEYSADERFPLAWVDPLFGRRGHSPVTVQEWSKGVAVNEEKLDMFPERER